MPISSYPRVTVQGTGTAQNTQNGSALMVVNPSTGRYEAATAATFSGGGGGGGDATAANQTTQIEEAIAQTSFLNDVKNTNSNIETYTNQTQTFLVDPASENTAGTLLGQIQNNTSKLIESNSFLDSIANQGLLYDGTHAARYLDLIKQYTESTSNSLIAYGKPNAEYLNDIALTLIDIKNLLTDIKNNQTSGSQRTVLQDSSGNLVSVTDSALNVETGM
jgi:hypothetical protein